MNESFELPVTYRGEERLFPALLQQRGYTHHFIVEVNGQEIFFEPDEERNYRALIDSELSENSRKIEVELLRAIADAIEAIVK